MQNSFEEQLKKAVSFFNSFEKDEIIRVISHHDADGICAASIMVSALNNLGRNYSISIVPQLENSLLLSLSGEKHKNFIFTDLGSGQISMIRNIIKNKKILILDHHNPDEKSPDEAKEDGKNENEIMHVNPHLNGINGSTDISGAGVVFEFVFALDKANKRLSYLAVIGAIGDCQENNGFTGRNNNILKTAEEIKAIKIKKGLRLFGAQSKPLYKLLEFCYEPYIPGVTGSEEGALKFLKSIGINPRAGNSWKMLDHLTDDEAAKLSNAITEKISNTKTAEKLIGNVYIICSEKEGPLRDAKEFSTVLNSCGRMGKSSIGIGVCLGDEKMKKKAVDSLYEYKRELMDAMRWFYESLNIGSKNVIKKNGYILINAKQNIIPSIAGTLASILSRSQEIKGGTVIIAMARQNNKQTKISLRIAGNRKYSNIYDMREIVSTLASKVKGEYGGHNNAAGAIIETSKEKEFIEFAENYFLKKGMEERII